MHGRGPGVLTAASLSSSCLPAHLSFASLVSSVHSCRFSSRESRAAHGKYAYFPLHPHPPPPQKKKKKKKKERGCTFAGVYVPCIYTYIHASQVRVTVGGKIQGDGRKFLDRFKSYFGSQISSQSLNAVSYTHLTLPTKTLV